MFDLNEKSKVSLNRIQSLEQKIASVENDKSMSENNIKIQLKQFAEDNKNLIFENENVNRKYHKNYFRNEKLYQDLKITKNEFLQLREDLSSLTFDNKKLNEINNLMINDKAEIEDYIKSTNNNNKALEERLVIVIHERDLFETLLDK